MLLEGMWPWWLGALAIGVTCLGHPLIFGRPCSVSGFWAGVINWRQEREAARAEAAMAADPEAAEAAMLEAAMAELGGEIPAEMQAELDAMSAAEAEVPTSAARATAPRTIGPGGYLAFLVGLAGGGFLAALARGAVDPSFAMDTTFHQIFGPGFLLALGIGGVLVGFGTRMAGGCSMGHGLAGTSALQPGSLLATGTFFATAVVVSLLLGKVL